MKLVTITRRMATCGHAYAGDGRWRYACTLDLDHEGDYHEDHLTAAPSVYVWIKPELISPCLPRMRVAPVKAA